MEKYWGDYGGVVGKWRAHKRQYLSETRKDRGKVTMEGLYELTNALLNGTIADPLRPFQGTHIYDTTHRAVIFAVAQISCCDVWHVANIHKLGLSIDKTNPDFGARLDCEVLIKSEILSVLAVDISLDQPLANHLVLRCTFIVNIMLQTRRSHLYSKYRWLELTKCTTVCTRSSATAEKQRVSCPHGWRGEGLALQLTPPLGLYRLWLYLCIWSNPKATTYVRQACRR